MKRFTTSNQISTHAVELFRQMRDIACTCTAVSLKRCPGCDRWWQLHSELHDALGLSPDQWLAVEDPDEPNPWPPESAGHTWFPQAQQLWRELERRAAA